MTCDTAFRRTCDQPPASEICMLYLAKIIVSTLSLWHCHLHLMQLHVLPHLSCPPVIGEDIKIVPFSDDKPVSYKLIRTID